MAEVLVNCKVRLLPPLTDILLFGFMAAGREVVGSSGHTPRVIWSSAYVCSRQAHEHKCAVCLATLHGAKYLLLHFSC